MVWIVEELEDTSDESSQRSHLHLFPSHSNLVDAAIVQILSLMGRHLPIHMIMYTDALSEHNFVDSM